jgi:rhodanese-related sulfurtransferase
MSPAINEMSPAAVAEALRNRTITLIDVREPAEYAAARIHGALLFPLSTFDPAMLPQDARRIVLHCGSGKRSAMAIQRCHDARLAIDTHMQGGIQAWAQAGLPVVKLDPATGAVTDKR